MAGWIKRGAVTAAAATAPLVAHAGSLDRLKGVSDHAKKRVSDGPEHLVAGILIFGGLAVLIGVAAWWVMGKKKD